MADYYKRVDTPITKKKIGRPDETFPAYAYMFNDITDIEQFIEEQYRKALKDSNQQRIASYMRPMINTPEAYVERNIRSMGEGWFGTNDSSWAGRPLQVFLGIDELRGRLERLSQKVGKIDVSNLDQRPEIQFTDEEKGIFSFDLASLGLYRLYEYYSPLLKQTVSPNVVRSYKNGAGTTIFYHVEKPAIPKHECKWSGSVGGFYSPVLQRKVEQSDLVTELTNDPIHPLAYYYPEKEGIPQHDVQRKQSTDKHGKPRFSSSWKKSFIYIPKVEKELRRIDLIIPLAYSGELTTEQIHWNTVAVLAIAQKLNNSNIQYRIIASRSIKPSREYMRDEIGERSVFCFIKIKDESEQLDINELSVIISDTRFYRYKLFLLSYAMQYDCGFDRYAGEGVSIPISDVDLVKSKYIEFLSKQESETDRESAKYPTSKIVVPLSLSENQAKEAYMSTINQIEGL